jgi:hypothetical protein
MNILCALLLFLLLFLSLQDPELRMLPTFSVSSCALK